MYSVSRRHSCVVSWRYFSVVLREVILFRWHWSHSFTTTSIILTHPTMLSVVLLHFVCHLRLGGGDYCEIKRSGRRVVFVGRKSSLFRLPFPFIRYAYELCRSKGVFGEDYIYLTVDVQLNRDKFCIRLRCG